MQNLLKKNFGAKYSIFILEISAVTVLIIALTAVKFFAGNTYKDVREWYIKYFCCETRLSEVLEDDTDNIIEDEKSDTQSEISKPAAVTDKSVLSVSAKVYEDAADNNSEILNSLYFPVNSTSVTSEFGERINPITDVYELHKGIDLGAEEDSAIYAAADGVVYAVDIGKSYGNYIILDHGEGLKTVYAHCNKVLKEEGARVKRGEKIALVGATGQATGPHLHFEVRANDNNINPQYLLDW